MKLSEQEINVIFSSLYKDKKYGIMSSLIKTLAEEVDKPLLEYKWSQELIKFFAANQYPLKQYSHRELEIIATNIAGCLVNWDYNGHQKLLETLIQKNQINDSMNSAFEWSEKLFKFLKTYPTQLKKYTDMELTKIAKQISGLLLNWDAKVHQKLWEKGFEKSDDEERQIELDKYKPNREKMYKDNGMDRKRDIQGW